MIKKKFIFLIFVFALFLTGCGKEPIMDQPAEDGNFHYRNKDFGFNLTLPPEFLYYQVQRKETGDYTDLEFFVPTADQNYYQDVAGYGKVVVIRIFDKNKWEQMGEEGIYQKVGEKKSWLPGKKDKIYTIKFWNEAPVDWQTKWSEEMEKKIIEGFEVR